MTKKRRTRRALINSVISLIICFSMLLGTTFAWFTDSASTGMNQIIAGNLDIELVDANGKSVQGSTELFSEPKLWEPGAVSYAQLQVKNVGTLDLKYNMSINYQDVNDLNGHKLSEVLEYAIIDSNVIDSTKSATEQRTAVLAAAIASTNKGDLDSYKYEHVLKAGASDPLQTLVVFWNPNTNDVDNLYNANNGKVTSNGKPLEIDLGIKVEAIQVGGEGHEEDSFGPDYDLNAPTVITIKDDATATVYTDLEAAIAAARAMSTVDKVINLSGPSVLYTAEGTSVDRDMSDITINGGENAVIIFKNAIKADGTESQSGGTGSFSGMDLNNLTVIDETYYTAENGENAWEFTYLEFAGENEFTNVTFTDGIMVEGTNSTFTECTFIGHNNDSSEHGNGAMYGVWVGNGNATFEVCTFTGTRGLKVHEAYGSAVGTVKVNESVFDGLTEKPGVAIGNIRTEDQVVISESKFIDCQPGDQNQFIYETDTVKPTLNNSVIGIDDVTTLFDFADYVNKDGITYAGLTVKLLNDIDLQNQPWTPIGSAGKYFSGTFDGAKETTTRAIGDNYTISNLMVTAKQSAGLFGELRGTVKNLNIDEAIVNGNHYAGTIAAYCTDHCSAKIENCNVTNATITLATELVDGKWDNGDKAGGIMGYIANGNPGIYGCTVANTTIQGYRDLGGFVGYAGDALPVENCVIGENVVIKVDNSHNYKEYTTNEEYDAKSWVGEGGVLSGNTGEATISVLVKDTLDGEADTTWYNAEETSFEIESAEELVGLSVLAAEGNNFAGKTIELMTDVDLGGQTWTPIKSFAGEFDGNDKTISNLVIDATSARGGFFNVIEAGDGERVHDLTLTNVKATVGNNRFGTLANSVQGIVNRVTVKDVEVTTTDSAAWVGGMCAFMSWPWMNDCTVENVTVNAENGADLVAGFACILQKNSNMVFDNNDVKGFNVTVTDTTADGCGVAGFATQTQTGWQSPKIINSDITDINITASGNVDVAGFVAWPGAHTILENCTTEGTINATGVTGENNSVGGFFGNLGWNADLGQKGHVVTNCSADVDVISGGAPAGGFVGSATNLNNASMYAEFYNCVATGDVTNTNGYAGGFAGDADRGLYNNCNASGKVTGNYAGGFIGAIEDVTPKYDHRYPAGTRDYLVDEIFITNCVGSVSVNGTTVGNNMVAFTAEGTNVTYN